MEIAGQHHGGTLSAFGEFAHHVGPLREHEQLIGLLRSHARFLDGLKRILDAKRDGLALVRDAFARLLHAFSLSLGLGHHLDAVGFGKVLRC